MADIVDTLNDLIARCRESEAGFGEAGEYCRNARLRDRLTEISRQRGEFALELAGYVSKLNGVPASGRRKRPRADCWPEFDESLRSGGDVALISACIAGGEVTLHAYEIALTQDLPVAVRPVVDRQRLAVQETILELRNVQMVRTA